MIGKEEGLLLHLSSLKRDLQINKVYDVTDLGDLICDIEKAVNQVVSRIPTVLNELNGELREITMGDFDDCIQDAMDEAEKKMFALLVSPDKKLQEGSTSKAKK